MTALWSARPRGRRPSRSRRPSRRPTSSGTTRPHCRSTSGPRLHQVSRTIAERLDEIAQLISAENGKPIMWARAEASRAVSVFRIAAEEARRWSGEAMRLDTDKAAEGRLAYVRRVPKGTCSRSHRSTSPSIWWPTRWLRPRRRRARGDQAGPQDLLGVVARRRDRRDPPGMVSVLNVPNDQASDLVADERLPVVSFTGSGPVGWAIQKSVPHKHVTLELGGTLSSSVRTIQVMPTSTGQQRVATFSNYQAGQSRIGVQRVYVAESLYDDFKARVLDKVAGLKVGDPGTTRPRSAR